jgi:hypothetical protein
MDREQVTAELARIRRQQREAPTAVSGADGSDPLRLEDFVAYLPKHNYVFLPTREPWPASSVNARIAPVEDDDGEMVTASVWLDQNRPVEQMTWCPGLPMLIEGKLVSEGGWIERPGCTILNLYRPPLLKLGNAASARPWLEHVHRIYPNEAGPYRALASAPGAKTCREDQPLLGVGRRTRHR